MQYTALKTSSGVKQNIPLQHNFIHITHVNLHVIQKLQTEVGEDTLKDYRFKMCCM